MVKKKTRLDGVSKAMQVQLSRLFGKNSKEASCPCRTPAQWRRTLKRVIHELDLYLTHNIDTDDLHLAMLFSGLASADFSLQEEDFWPGYAEGITRLALLLMGDYPDHRERQTGRRKQNHYKLDRLRSVHWTQTPHQRLNTLIAVGATGFPQLSKKPLEVLMDFRRRHGYGPSYREFFDWYREFFPADYAAVFR